MVTRYVLLAIWLGISGWPSLAPSAAHGLVAAQEPAAGPINGLNPGASCDVIPRTQENVAALILSGLATPHVGDLSDAFGAPPPSAGGRPADEAIVRAVTETMQETVACINAGDFFRLSALWTDALVRRTFSRLGLHDELSPEEVARQVTEGATPVPLPADQQAHLNSVSDVLILGDDRVSAIVQINETPSLVIFANAGERYLIDAAYEAPAGTPTP